MDLRERREKLEKLASLDDIHIRVMYYRCLGKKVSEITDILELENEATIWARFTKIFEKLDIKGGNKEGEMVKKYSPLFLEFIKSENDWKNWGLIKVEILRQVEELSSQSDPPKSEAIQNQPEQSPTTSPPPTPAESQQSGTKSQVEPVRPPVPRWPVIAIPLLILCTLGIAGVLFGWRIIVPMIQNGITPAQETPTDTIASIPSQLPQLTDTALPSDTSPIDTATIQPTNTPIPTATPNPNIFLDDFTDGLDPAWTVVYGKPIVVNGQLTSSELTLLFIGDSTWKDYEIEFDVKLTGNLTEADSSYVGIRARNVDNFLLFAFAGSETKWFYVNEGTSTFIPDTKTGDIDDRNLAHFVIRAEGNQITLREHAGLITSFIDTDYQSGYVYLKFSAGTLYDNFKITLLNR